MDNNDRKFKIQMFVELEKKIKNSELRKKFGYSFDVKFSYLSIPGVFSAIRARYPLLQEKRLKIHMDFRNPGPVICQLSQVNCNSD